MMSVLRWCLSIALLAMFGWISIGNLWIAWSWYVRKKRESMLPFVGGLLGAAGIALLPHSTVSSFFLIPLVADFGCGFMFVGICFEWVRRLCGRNKN